MSKNTGFIVDTVKLTGRGSDYFGACEVCGRHMSETALFVRYKIFQHDEGFFYLAAPNGGTFAHMGCKVQEGRHIVNRATLPKRGNLLEYPRWALENDLKRAGISESNLAEAMP